MTELLADAAPIPELFRLDLTRAEAGVLCQLIGVGGKLADTMGAAAELWRLAATPEGCAAMNRLTQQLKTLAGEG